MSSDAGHTTRESTRTVIALLTVVGFVLIAAVLPVVGGDAPGRSLVPQNLTGEGLSGDQKRDAVEQALEGQSGNGSASRQGSGGSKSMVRGLLSTLSEGGARSAAGEQQGPGRPSGQGESSAFGALDPGSQTGVGSTQNLMSQSLRDQSSTPHLLVRSSEPGYWRTGAFGTYTGSGWDAEDLPVRAEWPRQPATAPEDRRTVTQEYRLLQPATALPSVWQPTDVESGFANELTITQQGAIQARSTMPANTTYTVVSQAPPRDPERLQQTGRDYPDRIEDTYTQLPDSTPQRIADRTDRITRDAATPYETAVAIESWLESNKEYSLNASHDEGDVADQFVFEMNEGYCEYFATSMTVMLRSQDIPARYTVGYSTGQPQGNGTYLVRAMNAHAWVEVYFPETGWVRFDPTPGRSRLQSEFEAYRRAAENGNAEGAAERFLDQADEGSLGGRGASGSPGDASGGQSGGDAGGDAGTPGTQQPNSGDETNASDVADSYNHTEEGSPGESFDPSEGPSYGISLQDDPVPGQPVTVLVERDGDPAADVVVAFNGERIGRTNASGMVRGEVPFAARLTVNVRDDGAAQPAASASLLGPGGGAAMSALSRDRSVRTAGGAVQPPNGTNVTRSFDVPTNVGIDIEGTADPGETVTVVTTIDDRPITDATVLLDGTAVGTTDAAGELDVSLPGKEVIRLEARRGEAYGNRTVRLANISVNTSGFALPGLGVTVSVTDQGRPVEGATVSVGGKTATTGPDGQAKLSLPVATSATVQVETAEGITESQPVTYRFLTAGIALVLALVAVAVLVVLQRRAAAAGISVREQLVATLYWLSGAFVSALVGMAIWGERLLSQFPAVARRVARALGDAWRALVAAIRAQELDLSAVPGPRAILAWFLAILRGVATSARSSVSTPLSGGSGTETTATTAADEATAPEPDARERVRRAWREFRGRLPVADYRTKTPGELAQVGIDEGFPSGAVGTLRDAVQAIEYGRRDPASYLDDVTAAERELGGAADGDEDTQPADGARSGTPHATDGGESE